MFEALTWNTCINARIAAVYIKKKAGVRKGSTMGRVSGARDLHRKTGWSYFTENQDPLKKLSPQPFSIVNAKVPELC